MEENQYDHKQKIISSYSRKEEYLSEDDQILCYLCMRTKVNGIRCLGKCVAESEY